MSESYRLSAPRRGVLEDLTLEPADRRDPGLGEIEIAVDAAGLNFRDVMNVLGVYPGEAGPLGLECAGTVARVGAGVDGLRAGDDVVALAPGTFQRFVVADARLAVRRPRGLSAIEAATIPIAFMTAYYALHDLGALKAGERVLVHAAAGGVGMAAVQLAVQAGAEVYGTASPWKWSALDPLVPPGAGRWMSSRDLAFADELMARTRGEGVALVLNALTGDFIPKSLSVLAPGGRFLEMGKAEVLTPERAGARRPDVSYRAFDLMEAGPERLRAILATLVSDFEAGRLRPMPHTAFPLTRAVDAFRTMAQARHVGKIVLEAARGAERAAAPEADATAQASLLDRLARAPASRRRKLLIAALQEQAAKVLGHAVVDPRRPLRELGVDSLTAVELRNLMSRALDRPLPATLVFDHPSLEAIADHLLGDRTFEERPAHVVEPTSAAGEEPIAILGIGCRFPGGANDPESFWRLLAEGRDAIGEVPRERWDVDAWYDPAPDAKGRMFTRWGGFLAGIEDFDPTFFAISPREAVGVDPQERILLETAFEALERAAISPDRLMGSDTGVYVGLCGNEYQARVFGGGDDLDAHAFLGAAHSTMVGRLSYFLGLRGPNLAIDTACSSSLVALHLACQALRAGECRLALAGGANVVLSPKPTVHFCRLQAMSPTGKCRAFSADADGYVRSEGGGVVVLKRLGDALRDGDPVLAVIRGTAVNQDGRSNGPTAPNGPSQEAVIRRALARSGVAPSQVDYVECHGTGTPLGDPIEIQALSAALGEGRPKDRPFLLGSVKTNIGHTEGAAGIAGLIKTVLALQHETIPKSLHFTTPNPHVRWSELPVEVARRATPWPRGASPRIAGVSSFGMSGTNAHVVVEEAPPAPPSTQQSATEEVVPVLVSGKSEKALLAQAERLRGHLRAHPGAAIADVAFSLATTRAHFERRAVVVAKDHASVLGALDALAEGRTAPELVTGEIRAAQKIAFLFPGQGSQVLGMGRELARTFPAFRAALDEALQALDPHLPRPLAGVMWAQRGTDEAALLSRTQYTQPALFALAWALAALLRSFGVEPDLLVGHSVGELAAAAVAGVFCLEEGARLVAARGRLMEALPGGGGMVSIEASEEEVRRAIAALGASRAVDVAGINAPDQTTVSGDEAAVAAICNHFGALERGAVRLDVSHAFHSHRMDAMLDAYWAIATGIRYHAPSVPIVSNQTGRVAEADRVTTPDYWVSQVRDPVRFLACVRSAREVGADTFVELGPQPVLSPLGARCVADEEVLLLPSMRRGRSERGVLLHALGALHARGARVSWMPAFEGLGACRVALPTYAFQRRRYWLDPPSPDAATLSAPACVVAAPNDPRIPLVVRSLARSGEATVLRLTDASSGAWIDAEAARTQTVVCLIPGAADRHDGDAEIAEALWRLQRAAPSSCSFVFISSAGEGCADRTTALFVDALSAHRERRGQPVTRLSWDAARLLLRISDVRSEPVRGDPTSAHEKAPPPAPRRVAVPAPPRGREAPRELERSIAVTLREEVARLLEIEPGEISAAQPLAEYGFDSLLATELRAAIEARFGVKLDKAVLYDHPTIQQQAAYLRSILAPSTAEAPPSEAGRAPADAPRTVATAAPAPEGREDAADDLLRRMREALEKGE